MPVDRIGNTPRQAKVISASAGYNIYRDQIGGSDRNDYFRLNLSDRHRYSLSLGRLSQDANLQLLNAAGRVIQRSFRPGRNRESITTTLEAGSYFIQVFPGREKSLTRYVLGVAATLIPPTSLPSPVPVPTPEPIPDPMPDHAGDSSSPAKDLGTLSGDRTVQDAIGGADLSDYYRFNLTQASRFTLNLDNPFSTLSLLDANGANIPNRAVNSSVAQSATWELASGTYTLHLESSLSAIASYTLTLNATPDRVGNSRNEALDLDLLTRTQTLGNWLSERINGNDYYRFSLSREVNLALILDGLGQSTTAIDLLDSHGVSIESAQGAEPVKSITEDLTAGTYYLHIQGRSDYTLTLNLPSADLVAIAFDTPDALTAGSNFTANFQIQNAGDEAVGAFRVNFYLSSDSQISGGDRLLGHYDITALSANSTTTTLTTALLLPNANDLFWQTNGNYYIGISLDPLQVIREADENNNINRGRAIDQDDVNISGLPSTRPFNIEFDYSSDAIGWFTLQRRAAIEAAAHIWEKIIQDDFFGVVDLTLNVTADELGNTTAARTFVNSDFSSTGTIEFDLSTDWFFDATPNTTDDIPASELDFISVAVHEIGHSLGFAGIDDAFNSQVINNAFTGINAKANNGGNPIPLSPDGSHIRAGYELSNTGAPLMNPFVASGTRVLPTLLDLAILDDIRFTVNYSAASKNRSNNSASSQPVTFTRCGCAACLTNLS